MTNDLGDIRKIHFVGIGGIGMSGIAEILIAKGYAVSGSDLSRSLILDRLSELGARIFLGHHETNLQDAEIVVFSSAIPAENPELREAQNRNTPLIHRAEMLARLMRLKKAITVSGTHGKTTTSAMITILLQEAGLDPTAVLGGRLKALGSSARLGKGSFFVAEADESDRTFLRLSPSYAVVTNIDLDHMDQYRGLEDLQEAFLEHMNKVPAEGAVVLCRDDANLRSLLKKVHRRVITYGFEQEVQVCASQVRIGPLWSRYDCLHEGNPLGSVELNVPGRHNVLNSLAAVTLGLHLEIPFAVIACSLKAFRGAERRLEHKGERGGVWVMDDYGHHPAEVRAALESCKATGRRVLAVFQPHRYSRTQHLMREFGSCFEKADRLYLLDIYSAGEEPIPGVTSKRLAGEIRRHREVTYVPDTETIVELLEDEASPGDLLLTLGAGDVWKVADAFLEKHSPNQA